jgi:hypothetical protein
MPRPPNSALPFAFLLLTYDVDRSLNEAAADKIRKYRTDYNNYPPEVFKASRVDTVIMGRYPNFADLPRWIRKDSLRRISEYTLNMLVSSKSTIKSYCVHVVSFKPPSTVGSEISHLAGSIENECVNSHLKKISVVHSDRPERTYLKPSAWGSGPMRQSRTGDAPGSSVLGGSWGYGTDPGSGLY